MRTFENFQDPFEGRQSQTGARPRSSSANHQKPSVLRSAAERDSHGDNIGNNCEAAASTQKKRPSTAHAAFSNHKSSLSEESANKAFIQQHLGDIGKSVKPSIPIHDPSKVQIPGLEMSGVTAEQLDQAGMLYTDEKTLLKTCSQDRAAARGARLNKPPSGCKNMNTWRKRASSLAKQSASDTGANDGGPEMCKAGTLQRLKVPAPFYKTCTSDWRHCVQRVRVTTSHYLNKVPDLKLRTFFAPSRADWGSMRTVVWESYVAEC